MQAGTPKAPKKQHFCGPIPKQQGKLLTGSWAVGARLGGGQEAVEQCAGQEERLLVQAKLGSHLDEPAEDDGAHGGVDEVITVLG